MQKLPGKRFYEILFWRVITHFCTSNITPCFIAPGTAGLASSGSEHGSDVDMDDVIDDSPPPAARRGQRAGSSGVASAAKHKPVSTRIPAARGAYLAGSTGTGTRTPGRRRFLSFLLSNRASTLLGGHHIYL